jgi:hypothetical protein
MRELLSYNRKAAAILGPMCAECKRHSIERAELALLRGSHEFPTAPSAVADISKDLQSSVIRKPETLKPDVARCAREFPTTNVVCIGLRQRRYR